jgi:hypothetical protein
VTVAAVTAKVAHTAAEARRRAQVWRRVRKICATLDGAVEASSFGHPAFRAGRRLRPFVVLDHYGGQSCLWFRVDPGRRGELLADPAFFPAPYDRRETALCRRVVGIKWGVVKSLILYSYSSVK